MIDRAPAGSQSVASTLSALADAYVRTLAYHVRTKDDPTVTPAAREVRSARTARAALAPALGELKKARSIAQEGKASLLRDVAKVFDFSGDFAATMLAAEIRSHFAALPSNERLAALAAAEAAFDTVTLRAIGAGPAYLTGLPPAMHDHARNALIDLFPNAKAAREAARGLEEQEKFADLFVESILQSTADLIDFLAADSFEAAAQDAVAA